MNIPGNAIAQIGQSLMQFGEMGMRNEYRNDQVKNLSQFSKAETSVLSSIDALRRDFRSLGESRDDNGQPYFKEFKDTIQVARERSWKEVSQLFDDPEVADEFFPTFNEVWGQEERITDELVYTMERKQLSTAYFDEIDQIHGLQEISPAKKKEELSKVVGRMFQSGIASTVEEADQILQEQLYKVDFQTITGKASEVMQEGGWDMARRYIKEVPGLREEDRDDLYKQMENEWKYQEKRQEEYRKEVAGKKFILFSEEIDEGRIATIDYFYDVMNKEGKELSEAQFDKLRNRVMANQNEGSGTSGKTYDHEDDILNEMDVMHAKGIPYEEIDAFGYYNANAENFGDGAERARVGKVRDKLAEIKEQRGGYTTILDKVMSNIDQLHEDEPDIYTDGVVKELKTDIISFAKENAKGEMSSANTPSNNDSLILDRYNAMITERIDKFLKEGPLRDHADKWYLTRNERVIKEGEEGLYTGIVKRDLVTPYILSPEFADPETLKDVYAKEIFGLRYDQLSNQQENEVISNINITTLSRNVMALAKDELGIKKIRLFVDNRGMPLIHDPLTEETFQLRIEDKQEVWYKYIPSLDEFKPYENYEDNENNEDGENKPSPVGTSLEDVNPVLGSRTEMRNYRKEPENEIQPYTRGSRR